MRQAGSVKIALMVNKYLRLVDQPSKGRGMHDAITVALKFAPVSMRGFGILAPATGGLQSSVRGQTRIRINVSPAHGKYRPGSGQVSTGTA